MTASNFASVFDRLKAILTPYAADLDVHVDDVGHYALQTSYSPKWEKPLHFSEIKIGKRYVSFHVMPVYMYPELLENVSDDLKRRMQGKSCFNFVSIDETLFDELAQLVERGYQRVKADCF